MARMPILRRHVGRVVVRRLTAGLIATVSVHV
jgi:hypothetical protein